MNTANTDSDNINKKFTKAYNKIHHVYDAAAADDEPTLNSCIDQTYALLEKPGIPRYHTIKAHLL
jgi:hypothetical protein